MQRKAKLEFQIKDLKENANSKAEQEKLFSSELESIESEISSREELLQTLIPQFEAKLKQELDTQNQFDFFSLLFILLLFFFLFFF